MDWLILEIRCGTLSEFINKIKKVPTAHEKLLVAIEASKISERIIGSTPQWILQETQKYLEHFSFAVLMDKLEWAEECLDKIRLHITNNGP
jgi:hypothetical protein